MKAERENLENMKKLKKLKAYNLFVKDLHNFKSLLNNKDSKSVNKLKYKENYVTKSDTKSPKFLKNVKKIEYNKTTNKMKVNAFFLTDISKKDNYPDVISNSIEGNNLLNNYGKETKNLTEIVVLKKELQSRTKKSFGESVRLVLNKIYKTDEKLKGKLREVN